MPGTVTIIGKSRLITVPDASNSRCRPLRRTRTALDEACKGGFFGTCRYTDYFSARFQECLAAHPSHGPGADHGYAFGYCLVPST